MEGERRAGYSRSLAHSDPTTSFQAAATATARPLQRAEQRKNCRGGDQTRIAYLPVVACCCWGRGKKEETLGLGQGMEGGKGRDQWMDESWEWERKGKCGEDDAER